MINSPHICLANDSHGILTLIWKMILKEHQTFLADDSMKYQTFLADKLDGLSNLFLQMTSMEYQAIFDRLLLWNIKLYLADDSH